VLPNYCGLAAAVAAAARHAAAAATTAANSTVKHQPGIISAEGPGPCLLLLLLLLVRSTAMQVRQRHTGCATWASCASCGSSKLLLQAVVTTVVVFRCYGCCVQCAEGLPDAVVKVISMHWQLQFHAVVLL
jgi:hypothetical protein